MVKTKVVLRRRGQEPGAAYELRDRLLSRWYRAHETEPGGQTVLIRRLGLEGEEPGGWV